MWQLLEIKFSCLIYKEVVQIRKAGPESSVDWKENLREQASSPRENFVDTLLCLFQLFWKPQIQ